MPVLHDFQALLFDVDNTLNNSQKGISPLTKKMLEELQPKMYLSVCTGRIYASLEKYIFPFFASDSLHIISGGAQLIKTNGEIVWEKLIPQEISAKLCKQLLEHQIDFLLSKDQKMFLTPAFQARLTAGVVPISFGNVQTLTEWSTPLISIPLVTDEVRQIVAQFPDLTVKEMTRSSGTTYFDLTAAGVNKSTALEKWSEVTGIPLERVIGFGDSSNDLEFLEKIGFPIAMGNASAEIQSISQRVIGHTDQDGLAVYLQQISLGAEL